MLLEGLKTGKGLNYLIRPPWVHMKVRTSPPAPIGFSSTSNTMLHSPCPNHTPGTRILVKCESTTMTNRSISSCLADDSDPFMSSFANIRLFSPYSFLVPHVEILHNYITILNTAAPAPAAGPAPGARPSSGNHSSYSAVRGRLPFSARALALQLRARAPARSRASASAARRPHSSSGSETPPSSKCRLWG